VKLKAWACWGIAALMALFGLVVIPECVRDARRLSRLPREGQRITGEIAAIEKSYESTAEDSTDRARYGPSMPVEDAIVRYAVAGRTYEGRHRLPEPGIRRVGEGFPLLVLPDEPARSYAPGEVTGNWIVTLLMPALLLLGAVMFGFSGWLLGDVAAARS
jgi:hypothetical protein